MGDQRIRSENQSGGITAGNVNVGAGSNLSVQADQPKESRAKSIFWWVFGLASLVGVAIAAYQFFT